MAKENGFFNYEKQGFIALQNDIQETINILGYWHILLRQKRYAIYTGLLILIIGLPIIYALKPIYQSTAKIVVDTEQSKLVGLEIGGASGGNLDYKVNTEVEIIKSNKVKLRTIRNLQLWNSSDYNESSFQEKLLALVATKTPVKANSSFRKYSDLSGQEIDAYLTAISKNLIVSQIRRTNVIEISVTSPFANRAADIANNITRSYLSEKVESKANSIREAADVLRTQLNKLSIEIQGYEHQIENFILEQSGKINSAEVRAELEKLRLETTFRIDARLAKTLKMAKIDRSSASKNYSLLASLTQDENIGTLYSRYQTIDLQLSDTSLSIDDKFNLSEELDKIEINLKGFATKLRDNLSQSISNSRSEILKLKKARQKLFADQNLPEEVSLALYRLTNDIESKRRLYETESTKYSEVEQKIGILIPDVRVIATAFPSLLPIKPNKSLLAIGTAIFAVFCGIVIATIRDKLIGGFSSSEQVKSVLGVLPLSVIPKHENADTQNIISNAPLSRFSEAIRMLRIGLDNNYLKHGTSNKSEARLIAITSTLPKEGKTTTALSLARSYALSSKNTILIDLDFRHPAICDRIGLEKSYGLQDFIRESRNILDLDELVLTEEEVGLDIILSGEPRKISTDILVQSEILEEIIAKLKQVYDIIIIDTPPVGLVADTQIIAQKVDQMVYVIKHASTSQKNVLTGISYINHAKSDLDISVIITQQNEDQASYYGMYGAEYSYYYNR